MPACYLQPPPGRACMQCVFCCPNESLLARVFDKEWSESEEKRQRKIKGLQSYRGNKRRDKRQIKQDRTLLGWLFVDLIPFLLSLKEQSVTGRQDGGSVLHWPMTGRQECVPDEAQITASRRGPAQKPAMGISAPSISGGTGQLQVSWRDPCTSEQSFV